MKKWRTALIGLGRMGRYHLQKIDQDPRFDLVAVVDPEQQDALKLSQSNPKIVGQVNDIFKLNLTIDCAIVATPTETHYSVVKYLLEQNIHVLVEKPAASRYEECVKLVDLARERALKLAVGHVERGNPVVTALKDVVASGILGQPVHVSTNRAGAFPAKVKEGNHVILDLAVHDLDIVRMILGPLTITHAIGHSTSLPGIYDTAEISLTSSEGISAAVHVNWLTPQKDRRIRLTGSLGSCEVDYISQSCHIYSRNLQPALDERQLSWIVSQEQGYDRAEVPVVAQDALSFQLSEFYRYLNNESHGLAVAEQLTESVLLVEKAVELMGVPATQRFFHEKKTWQPAYLQASEVTYN
ncbi:MAG: Gfo/Idh/MocA family protein [Oligoflexus sp.]